jgi:hypothetical protein
MGLRRASIALLLLAACFASWLVLRRSQEKAREAAAGRAAAEDANTPAREGRADGPSALERPEPGSDAGPARAVAPGASPAAELREIGDSFLGDEPRAADLLQFVEELARRAVVDPASVEVRRDAAGAMVLARGTLTAGDLRGRFHFEEQTWRVHFSEVATTAPWIRRNLQFAFEPAGGRMTRCVASVQFETDPAVPASVAANGGSERLAGWAMDVERDTGARLRPMTVLAREDEWVIGSARASEVRSVPAAARTEAFAAWHAVLEKALGR